MIMAVESPAQVTASRLSVGLAAKCCTDRGELNVVNEVRPEFLRSLLLACCGKLKQFRVERIYTELEAGLSRSTSHLRRPSFQFA